MSVAALEAGKHVFSEKSMGRDVKQINQMLEAAKSHPDLVYLVGYQSRLNDSLKMVKEQHLAPGSPKISGGCGRLMCCLRYERSFYAESGKEFPKLGTKIEMGEGKGRVVAVDIFRRRVTLSDEEGKTVTVAIEDFKKGRITAVGTDEAPPLPDDYWGDAEEGAPPDEESNAG